MSVKSKRVVDQESRLIVSVSSNEGARLAALTACNVLDTGRETAFDNIVFTVAQLFRAPMAMLSLIDADRVWAKATVGPLQRQWDRHGAFCEAVLESAELLIIEDASADARFSRAPFVVDEPKVRFCAGAPLFGPNRLVIGALCVLDRHPRTVPDRQRSQLLQLAHEAGELLRLRIPDLDLTS